MATLHLMVGLPGSGKTTFAKKLAKQENAVLFSPDDWQFKLFGNDINQPTHDENHTKIEELMWDVAKDILKTGTDVILDFGCWAKEERDAFRKKAHNVGAGFKIHFMNTPVEEIWARLEKRNNMAGQNGVFYVKKEELEVWSSMFQKPTEEELEQSL
ncbi:MAG: ATP-binding protein [Clostridia bacterium]|nr:ATP-binding protein [Clostridia bacterium]